MSVEIQTARNAGSESHVKNAVANVLSPVGAETVDLVVTGLAGANATVSPDCNPIASCLPLGDQENL